MSNRRGATLVELLIAIGILAIVIGLTLAAVQKVRAAAVQKQSENNLRQIALGCHRFAESRGGRLPRDEQGQYGLITFMTLIHLELSGNTPSTYVQPAFISPADPTLRLGRSFDEWTQCSYAGNSYLFLHGPQDPARPAPDMSTNLTGGIPDGTSNTFLFAEHYSNCGEVKFSWKASERGMLQQQSLPLFAYRVQPKTTGRPPVSSAQLAGKAVTFQTQPCTWVWPPHGMENANEGPKPATPPCGSRPPCQFMLAQTPHAGGMLTALADGSVRQLRPDIAPEVYWGAVTPAGGETLADW